MANRLTRRVAAGIIGPELSETLTINPQQGVSTVARPRDVPARRDCNPYSFVSTLFEVVLLARIGDSTKRVYRARFFLRDQIAQAPPQTML